jgi:hypothetical protein
MHDIMVVRTQIKRDPWSLHHGDGGPVRDAR